MIEYATAAKQIAECLRETNDDSNKSSAYHLLLGVLDGIADQKPCPRSELVINLTLACINDVAITVPPNVAYLIGKCGFISTEVGRSR